MLANQIDLSLQIHANINQEFCWWHLQTEGLSPPEPYSCVAVFPTEIICSKLIKGEMIRSNYSTYIISN